jgi:alkylresorcinol/alkylpyrone synthase
MFMTKIAATGVALPPYRVPRSLAEEYARVHFGPHLNDLEKYLPVFLNTGIETRYFCVPPEWFFSAKSFSEKNQTYIEQATELSNQAAATCLKAAGISAEEIDNIIFVSTTGMATPTIDARLINTLKFRPDIQRTPVWGLGCVGGAAGLIMADNYIKAYPDARVLLVAVELCSLTFLFDDYSISNLVATSLFADGAAAVLLSGDGNGPEIISSHSQTWPDSLDVMGWNFLDDGLQVVFSKSIPAVVKKFAREDISKFLSKNGITLEELKYYLIHPGGTKVLDAYRKALDLKREDLTYSDYIIKNYGNMSSVTVLYILDRFLKSEKEQGKYGLLTALGPGFTAQSLLLKS